ncbi:hypothetical protein [Streptomyces chrestomyceticus]|uniref:hypothetical protein n=1 Tax=Streptomyces chrestomyceticus TaxID=68185 RepID=UPI0033E25417
MISLTHARAVRRAAAGSATTLAAAVELRQSLSARLGVDADLILGPVVGSEGQSARQAREDALADMAAAGFADIPYATALVAVWSHAMAGVIDDIEDADDERGYEPEDEFLGAAA